MAGIGDTVVCITVVFVVLVSIVLIFQSAVVIRYDDPEGFVYKAGYPANQLCKMPLTTILPQVSGPADATLDSPRVAYGLLNDYMEPATDGSGRLANLTSECAYIADGQRHIEKTGSYGQVTNNYKRKNPDDGSTMLRELSVSFYK
jgi:hypothetical protein